MAKMRVRPFYVVPILVIAGIALLWWYNHSHEQPSMMRQWMAAGGRRGGGGGGGRFGFGPLPVVVQPARRGAIEIYLNGLGTVTPFTAVTVRTRISGNLTEIRFKEGQEVKKGDVLAVIDEQPYKVALEQAEGQLAQSQSQLQDARANLARYKQLAKQDSIAQQQVDTQAAQAAQYEGAVKANQAAVDNAKLNLQYCEIKAPNDGRVGLRLVDAGNYVTPGDASGIVVLTQTKPITVVFSLPEDNVGQVSEKLHSGEKLTVDAFDRTMTKRLATGVLTSIDNEVDATTGTFRLKATFPNENEALFPNQFVNARLHLDTLNDVTVIPTSAIERGEQGTFVYVVQQPDNIATTKVVKLGASEGERVEVTSGLEDGALVVVDGADKLKEGSPVLIQKATDALPSTGVPADGGATKRGKRGNWKGKGKGNGGPGGWTGGGGAWGGPGNGNAPSAAPEGQGPSAASSASPSAQ